VQLRLNAWVDSSQDGRLGSPVSGDVVMAARWALQSGGVLPLEYLLPVVPEPQNWRDPKVGWGVVLRDGATIPKPLQALIDARGKAPVFRYLARSNLASLVLRNYGSSRDIAIEGAPTGTAPDALPTYLLIYGGPDEVPWRLQYLLNVTRCVGRVALTDEALGNYVNALLGWDAGQATTDTADPSHAVVWAVDHGQGDMTELMRNAIAAPLAQRLSTDPQLTVRFIDGHAESASVASLRSALTTMRPALIVTTSHGRVGPLDDPVAMRSSLGQLVASDGTMVTSSALLEAWQPAGAIWYAHACCSAGCDGTSNFAGLFTDGTQAATVLAQVAKLGSRIAALPMALLGTSQPLRAFIGHIEPTFDWTLQLPATGQYVTSALIDALYTRLFVGCGGASTALLSPLGYAFRLWFARTAGLAGQWRAAEIEYNRGAPVDDILLATSLAVRDLESTVILGDPTVAIPCVR
jgi:hypothetical protein